MSMMDALKGVFSKNAMLPEEQQISPYVADRITRSEERMQQMLPYINERYEFWRGQQYAYVDSKNKLSFLPTKTTPTGGGKRPWLSRSVNNLIMDIVAHEVSAATQRIPSYEVTPTGPDPEKQSAAKTSEKIALYGYDQWAIRHASVKAVTHAVVGQESFAWPYYDTTVGPMILDKNGKGVVGRGEVKIRIYGPQSVMWEPGIRFEDSPYHIVWQDQPLMAVVGLPGFLGQPVIPDAEILRGGRRGFTKAANSQLVRVYDYLELPSKSYPVGRWLTIANGRQIAKERPYPVPEGICLYPLSYIVDPDNDRDMSLVQHLMDPQRVYNDAWNKIVEWKNLALNPQLFIAPGVLQGQVITAEPGAIYEIPDPKNNMAWREVPNLPQELFQITEDMNSVIARLAAQNDIPSQVEAGKAIQALIERDMNRRQAFIAQVAEWHGHIASAGLRLVQEYYTEPRLIRIKGRWSPDTIKDFLGADLSGQIDVKVAPGSIEPRTKAAMEMKILAYADRGWITREQAMAAIEGGFTGEIVTSFELDIGRATRIIGRLKQGPEALYGTPDKPIAQVMTVDPMTGAPQEIADFMPRIFDNVAVQKGVWEDWMKTEEFEQQPPDIQNVAMEIYNAMLSIEAGKAAAAQAAMEATAAQKGMQNAQRSGSPDQPDAPGMGGDQNLQTPNQPADQSVPDRGPKQ